jgi:hypothetical protein
MVMSLAVAAVAVWYAWAQVDGQPAISQAAPPTTLPAACADALALARLMAVHVGPLAAAVNDHTDLMERLELFLEGKPGGLSGKQVYEQGQAQMRVFESHGPDAEVQVRRFKEVARRCPLK